MNSSVVAAVPAANFPAKCNKEATSLPLQRVKVGMISLGCAKNLVDAEVMLGSVLQCGMEITSRADDADVLVVNTCAFHRFSQGRINPNDFASASAAGVG